MEKIELGKITAICGDCMDFMKTIPDNYYDLAIVDPPYGIGADMPSVKPHKVLQKNGNILKVQKSNYGKINWDTEIPKLDYFIELKRVSKHQIIFGANYFVKVFPEIFDNGLIIWDKLNGNSDQMGCEIASVSTHNRTDIIYYMWHGMFQGKTCSRNIHQAMIQEGNKSKNQKRIHPTEKPTKLYDWLLKNYAKPDNKIIDTHGGSFSHALACHDLGYNLTIIEKEKAFFDKAIARLKNHQQQLKLQI